MYRYDNEEPLSVGGWIGTLLVMCVPIVNLVMIFVWGFGNGNQGRKNYALAVLILSLIVTALFIVITILNGAAISQAFSEMQNLTTY